MPLRVIFHLAVALLIFAPPGAAAKPSPLVFCYQPLASPGGVLVQVVKRDRILRRELARSGYYLQTVPVKDGSQAIVMLGAGGAHLATLGDMPLLKAMTELPLYAFALIKQNYATVVGPRGLLPSDLKGKRIGNAHGTSGHFALMKTLSGSGLLETDAHLVPLDITQMEDALLKGRVAAYAAWSPTPEQTLSRYPDRFAAIGRQKSLAFTVISRSMADRHPEIPDHLAAALLRAMNWLGRERKNLETAARWNLAEIGALKWGGERLNRAGMAQNLRADLSAIANAPRMPRGIEAEGSSLADEFLFLKKLGKISAGAQWSTVKGTFRFDVLDRVSRNAGRYRISDFAYED